MTFLTTAGHELTVIVGMSIWATLSSILIQFMNLPLPGNYPYNVIAGLCGVTFVNNAAADHGTRFSWTRTATRIVADIAVIIVGVAMYQIMYIILGVNYRHPRQLTDPTLILLAVANDSVLERGLVLILIYVANLGIYAMYRLVWHAICIPFLVGFGTLLEKMWPTPKDD